MAFDLTYLDRLRDDLDAIARKLPPERRDEFLDAAVGSISRVVDIFLTGLLISNAESGNLEFQSEIKDRISDL